MPYLGRKRAVQRVIRFLRDADWLTPQRVRVYATLMIIFSAASIAWTFTGRGFDDPTGRAVGTDFVSFWTVSWALLNGHQNAIYDPTALAALEGTVVQSSSSAFYAWQYPPIGLLVVYPLALLPYLWAFGAWCLAGAICYLSALWRIIPRPLTLWLGLGFPAVLLTITHGQNAFLTTALLTWGLLLLQNRPITAGILIGAVAFKPQLALLLPVALIAGRYWQTIIAASLTVLGLAAVTIVLFGVDVWQGFLTSTAFSHQMLNMELVPYFKMQSVFAAVRLAGGNLSIAYATQIIIALGAATTVAWVWRGPGDPDTKAAATLAAIPLATPFLLDYDLMILAPAIVLMVRKITRDGPLPWEIIILGLAAVLPLVSRIIAESTHILLAPVTVAALLAIITVRCHAVPTRPLVQPPQLAD
jgi:alpha-1,2-mannosyltransferase